MRSGIRNATDLPDPVGAIPIKSLLIIPIGIAYI
jgi:hypothetical protein